MNENEDAKRTAARPTFGESHQKIMKTDRGLSSDIDEAINLFVPKV